MWRKRRLYLLELAFPHKSIFTMFGPSSPTNRVIRIKFNASASLVFINDLQTIVVDEHVSRATLQLVR